MFGMWNKTPVVSEYQVPTFNQLMDLWREVDQEYASKGKNAADKLALLKLLKASLQKIAEIKKSSSAQLSDKEWDQLAFAEWLKAMEYLKTTTWNSRLLVIIRNKFNNKFNFNPLELSAVQKLIPLNILYKFKFEDHTAAYQQMFRDHDLQVQDQEKETLDLIQMLYAPIKAKQNLYLRCLSNEITLDIFFKDFYTQYCSQTNSDNPQHRMLARITEAIIKMNPTNMKDDKPHFLSMSHRMKLGWLSFLIDSAANSKFVYRWLSAVWGPDHSATHRIANQGLLNNYKYVPQEIKHESLCTIHHYLNGPIRSALEKEVNNRDAYPNEAPVYINSELHAIQKELLERIESTAPKERKILSTTTVSMGLIGALIGGIPGIGVGTALGFGAGLTDQAEILKGAFKDTTGFAMKCILGNGGAILGHYGSEIFVNETLKLALGTIVGGLCAAIGAATGMTISIIVTKFTPETYDLLVDAYRRICNDPQIRPILNQNLYKDLDPNLILCLKTLPRQVISEEESTKLLRLEGNEKAVKSMFDKRDNKPKIDFPKAPDQVLRRPG